MNTIYTRAILITGICIVLVGCGNVPRDYELDEKTFTPAHLKMIEQKIGVSLPAGARGLDMYNAQAQIDPAFIAIIQIPDSSSGDFIRELSEIQGETVSVTNYLVNRVTWWHPSTAKMRVDRRFFRKPSGDFVELLMCDENGRHVLYVDWASR